MKQATVRWKFFETLWDLSLLCFPLSKFFCTGKSLNHCYKASNVLAQSLYRQWDSVK